MSKSPIAMISLLLFVLLALTSADDCIQCSRLKPAPEEVCGSDNLTYESRVELACYNRCEKKKVKVVKKGPCQCLCKNTLEFLPVCASNGRTYPNKGAVKCHNECHRSKIRIVREGEC